MEVILSIRLPRPSGVIFDLDGTLVDTVRARIDGWVEALEAAGVPATGEQIAPMIGMDGRRLAREVAKTAHLSLDDHAVEAVDKAAGEAFDRRNLAPEPLPGYSFLIDTIEAAAIPWVIATSSRAEQVRDSVAALGLTKPPKIVDGSHVKHAKPAPDLLLLAASKLAAEPGACWAVGDSTWDMRAAVAGAITAIGVTAGSAVDEAALYDAGATLVVPTLSDLIAILDQVE